MSGLPVKFDSDGLIPAVVQSADTGDVLMMAYMNAEALDRTRETGLTHFWSRSRGTLWQKGATSGHIQRVKSISVNCYENCLLVRVEQVGAACHTGFPTCYFREIDANGNLVTVQERGFDPGAVNGRSLDVDALVAAWVGAYRWLADHDLSAESQTSRLLRGSDLADLSARVVDELREMAGVLRGEHGHTSPEADIVLEGSQALYWAVVTAIRATLTNEEICSSFGAGAPVQDADVAGLLLDEANRWKGVAAGEVGERLAAVASLVGVAAEAVRADLATIIRHDLSELRGRPYLDAFFATRAGYCATDL